MSTKEGYTEYGYRGLEEIRRLQSEIETLKKRITELEQADDEIEPSGTDSLVKKTKTALDRVHDKLRDKAELLKLHLKHYHMNTANFKRTNM